MSTQVNLSVLARFDALLGARDLSELDELCTPDMVNHALAPDRPAGLEGTRQFLATMGRSHFVDDAWHEQVTVTDDTYVVQFGERGGTWPGGPFLGFQASAGPYSRAFMCAYRFVDGRIAERWAIRDDLTMLRQLGAFSRTQP